MKHNKHLYSKIKQKEEPTLFSHEICYYKKCLVCGIPKQCTKEEYEKQQEWDKVTIILRIKERK